MKITSITSLKKYLHRLLITPQYKPQKIYTPKSYFKVSNLKSFPKISIVTPSYNHSHFLEGTIESVLMQNYPNLQYVIQDGNSKDNTLDILEKYTGFLEFKSEKDTGQAQAINRGFSRTDGEILAWLNSDDILLPGTLSYVAEYFSTHHSVDVIYGHRIIINEFNQETGRWVLPPHDDKMLIWADYVPQETLFWRRSIWEKVGGYIDESFQFAIDWELLLRFRSAGAKFVRVPRFLGGFRVHFSQKTQNWNALGEEEMNRLRYQCHQYIPSAIEVRDNIEAYIMRSFIHYQLYRLNRFKQKFL
jgi:glycosyltransferase involved in cell wall biosynthesis